MHRRYGWLVLFTIFAVVAPVYAGWALFQPQPQLPFTVRWVDAHSALIEPIPDLTPRTVHAGDRLLLAAQSRATRIALVTSEQGSLPSSASYPLVIERGAMPVRVTVPAVDGNRGALASWVDWLWFYNMILLAVIALLALWRGHDRAAMGIALWGIAAGPLEFASAQFTGHGNGMALLGGLSYWVFSLLGRLGFYVMAESIAGSALSSRRRILWRGLFALVLGAAVITQLGGRIAVVAAGWAGLMQPWWGLLALAGYLVPIALLVANHRHADARQRQRLRWLLWGSVVFVAGLIPADLSLPLSLVVISSGFGTVGAAAMLYAVLRHRVVDVTVALNRALVYAVTTSLVLGLFALLESLIERSALGHDAGLVLALAVPLGLGAALSSVHRRIEAAIERLIFRHQYRMETALRRFAEDCAFITQPESLFELSIEQIARHTGAPLVALYERTAEGYACLRQQGNPALPDKVGADDLAFVALRARNAPLELHDSQSALGTDGYAFPLMLRGSLLGALVVAERPSEHFAADERALLFHVAHEVGMALFALRAQESEARAQESALQAQASKARVLAAEARTEAREAQARATENQLLEARAREAQARARELEAHARESALLTALSALGSGTTK